MINFRIVKPPQLPDIDPELLDSLQRASARRLRLHQLRIVARFNIGRQYARALDQALFNALRGPLPAPIRYVTLDI